MTFNERFACERTTIHAIDDYMKNRKKISKAEGKLLLSSIVDVQKRLSEHGGSDKEVDHETADEILLKIIGDDEISKLFDEIDKWYA